MHGELKLIVDEDDNAPKTELMNTGATLLEVKGTGQYTWNLTSKKKAIETLKRVIEILEK